MVNVESLYASAVAFLAARASGGLGFTPSLSEADAIEAAIVLRQRRVMAMPIKMETTQGKRGARFTILVARTEKLLQDLLKELQLEGEREGDVAISSLTN